MTMYSTLIYPATQVGGGYTRPALPSTFIAFYASSPTWNPFSTNIVDRTEYWSDSAGSMTLDQVQLALYGLDGIKAQQDALLKAAYANAIAQPVSYTSVAGVTKTFPADPVSQNNVLVSIAGSTAAQATPTGFFWVATDGTQVPFTFADLQGLAAAMLAQGAPAFAHLTTQMLAVNAATTVLAVQAIGW